MPARKKKPAPARRTTSAAAAPSAANRVREASARRREAQKAGLRETILREATDLLAAEGYDAFSLRKLAERIGYSATTIYHHFRDKDDLVLAIMTAGFTMFAERLRGALATSTDPVAQLQALAHGYVSFGFENPIYYRVMFMQRCELWTALETSQQSDMMCSYELLKSTVQRAVDAGVIEVASVEATSCALWAQVHGVVALSLTMPFLDAAETRAMTEASMHMVMHGLIKR